MSALVAAALNRRQIGMSPVSRKTRMSRHMDHDMISLHKGHAGIGSHTNRSAPSSSSFSSSALHSLIAHFPIKLRVRDGCTHPNFKSVQNHADIVDNIYMYIYIYVYVYIYVYIYQGIPISQDIPVGWLYTFLHQHFLRNE